MKKYELIIKLNNQEVNKMEIEALKGEKDILEAYFKRHQLKDTRIKKVYISYGWHEIQDAEVQFWAPNNKDVYKYIYKLININ